MFEFVLNSVVAGGLVAVALLMLAENVFPPIPSEVIMPLAGFAAAQGALSFPGVVLAGTLGAVAGAWLWYFVGLRVPEPAFERWVERHGRWLTLDRHDLERSRAHFRRHGEWAVFLGRLLPGVRTFISVPAGLMRMPFAPFIAWTTLGTAIWTAFLAGAGYLLGRQFRRVEAWMDPVAATVMIAVAALYLYRVVRYRRH